MNIIFYRYNSICEPDYIDAFKRMGLTVIEDPDGMDLKLDVSQKLLKLGDLVIEHKPLFIFSINYFPFLSIMCERIGVIYISETVDCPVFEIFHESIKNKCNRLFLFDKKQYESIKGYNERGIFYLPLGSAAERTSALLGDTSDYKYDVSFIGSLYNEKDPFGELHLDSKLKDHLTEVMLTQIEKESWGLCYLENELTDEDIKKVLDSAGGGDYKSQRVMDISSFYAVHNYMTYHMAYLERVKILNYLAENLVDGKVSLFTRSDTKEIDSRVRIHGGVKSLTEMPFVFRQSKINLNITMRSIQTGIPQRIWDVLGCGGFLLTNDQPEIHDYFIPGVHLETYSSMEELSEKICFYMEHEDKRREIARKGFEEVINKHTVFFRAMEMIKKVVG